MANKIYGGTSAHVHVKQHKEVLYDLPVQGSPEIKEDISVPEEPAVKYGLKELPVEKTKINWEDVNVQETDGE